MNNILGVVVFLILSISHSYAQNVSSCATSLPFLNLFCQRLHQIWYEGNNEIYGTGYSWHNRFTYTKAKLRTYNEKSWGGGLGKGFYDEKGDWHGLYVIAFLDSHKNIEPALGYAFLKVAHLGTKTKIGGGFTMLVTQRPDIAKGRPFPGALPWVSLIHEKLTFAATYIPGSQGAGNVLFMVGKWTFGENC